MIALNGTKVITVPIADARGQMKTVPLDSDILQTAREMGLSFCEPDKK
jgi:ATP-dependent phosphofructokinase / diphosphate-dependent phosphofructokinase